MTDLKTVEARRVEDGQDVVPLMHFDRPDFLEKPRTSSKFGTSVATVRGLGRELRQLWP